MADDRAVRALAAAALKIARGTTSGRLGFAQAHALVDPAALPPRLRQPIMAELDGAAAAVAPIPSADVAKVLERAWGDKPSSVLSKLDLESPVAVTAGAQVHRGELDGEAVAVKVLRPGLAEIVRSDLMLLDTLGAPAAAAFPAVDVMGLIRHGRDRLLDELDLEHGATAQRAAARRLRRDAALSVPAPVTDLTVDDVIVTAFVDGPTVTDGLPPGADPDVVAGLVLRFFAGAPRSIGMVHADADPANIIVTPNGIAIVDFGATGLVDAALLDAALDGLQALRDNDGAAFAHVAVDRLAVLPDAAAAAVALRLLRAIGGDLLTGPARLDTAALVDAAARAEVHFADLLALAVRLSPAPEHLAPVRMLSTLVPTLARFGVTLDWIALGIEHGRKGW